MPKDNLTGRMRKTLVLLNDTRFDAYYTLKMTLRRQIRTDNSKCAISLTEIPLR